LYTTPYVPSPTWPFFSILTYRSMLEEERAGGGGRGRGQKRKWFGQATSAARLAANVGGADGPHRPGQGGDGTGRTHKQPAPGQRLPSSLILNVISLQSNGLRGRVLLEYFTSSPPFWCFSCLGRRRRRGSGFRREDEEETDRTAYGRSTGRPKCLQWPAVGGNSGFTQLGTSAHGTTTSNLEHSAPPPLPNLNEDAGGGWSRET